MVPPDFHSSTLRSGRSATAAGTVPSAAARGLAQRYEAGHAFDDLVRVPHASPGSCALQRWRAWRAAARPHRVVRRCEGTSRRYLVDWISGEVFESYMMINLHADAHPLVIRMHKPDL
jgi:hypothetical protein